MRPAMSYTTNATPSRKKNWQIFTFAQFEEESLLSETRDNTENGNKYDDD